MSMYIQICWEHFYGAVKHSHFQNTSELGPFLEAELSEVNECDKTIPTKMLMSDNEVS